MKKAILLSLTISLTTLFTNVLAQSEIPNRNKPTVRTQTGGPEGGNGASKKASSNSGGNERPVYRPRVITPQPFIYNPNPYFEDNSGNRETVSDADMRKAYLAKRRAMAEIELKKALFEFKAPKQAFDIRDVSKSFEIIGSKGFKVTFPELAFVDDEGNPVLGEVEIQLTEFTENSEFAEAGLTTLTTDGEMLETGGMVNIEAMSGDKKLKLANGKTIDITVPDLKDKKGFQTFYGRGSDMVTWSLNPTSDVDTGSDRSFDGYTIKMVKTTQLIAGKQVSMLIFRNWKPLEDYVNENLKVSDAVRAKIMKDGIPFLYTIEVNAFGRIKEVKPKYPEYSKNTLITDVQGKLKSILLDAPPLAVSDGNLEGGRSYDIMFATAKNYTNPGPFNFTVTSPLDQREKKADERETNRNPNSENVDEFVMNSSQLSKVNCDRFTSSNSKDTQTFNFERADAKVYIVFKDQRSFIQPSGANGSYMMKKVPSNSAVRYVAVVYGDDGTIKMGVKDDLTKHGPVTFENYEEFNAERLKSALNGG